MSKIAIIRVRGSNRMASAIRDTLTLLRLHNKNHCVVLDLSPSNAGMIKKVKD